jgi:hypothetical protein
MHDQVALRCIGCRACAIDDANTGQDINGFLIRVLAVSVNAADALSAPTPRTMAATRTTARSFLRFFMYFPPVLFFA